MQDKIRNIGIKRGIATEIIESDLRKAQKKKVATLSPREFFYDAVKTRLDFIEAHATKKELIVQLAFEEDEEDEKHQVIYSTSELRTSKLKSFITTGTHLIFRKEAEEEVEQILEIEVDDIEEDLKKAKGFVKENFPDYILSCSNELEISYTKTTMKKAKDLSINFDFGGEGHPEISFKIDLDVAEISFEHEYIVYTIKFELDAKTFEDINNLEYLTNISRRDSYDKIKKDLSRVEVKKMG